MTKEIEDNTIYIENHKQWAEYPHLALWTDFGGLDSFYGRGHYLCLREYRVNGDTGEWADTYTNILLQYGINRTKMRIEMWRNILRNEYLEIASLHLTLSKSEFRKAIMKLVKSHHRKKVKKLTAVRNTSFRNNNLEHIPIDD